MQAKDIDQTPILEFLADNQGEWCNWFEIDGGWDTPLSVKNVLPKNIPDKVILAKMKSLIKRGLVSGCDCGCRGDYEITDKGLLFIGRVRTKEMIG
jgi:hypothetical protein